MKNRIVITGIGAISAQGNSIESICGPALRHVKPVSHGPSDAASCLRIADFDGSGVVNGRLKKKLDNFSVYGLCAAGMALDSSALLDGVVNKDRIGIFVGNCLGGWGFTEPKLMALHTEGVDSMGPYVATAWFPAALQGQISLQYGLRGYSKTFSTSSVAGLQAIGYAIEAIRHGRADAIVCGASEDLSSTYVRAMLERYDVAVGTSVFGYEQRTRFGEGAAFLVIESYERAKARGATVYCEITGFADHFCSISSDLNSVLQKNMTAVLKQKTEPHLLMLDGLFAAEQTFTREANETLQTPIHMTTSKDWFGNMFAVSGVLETVCAAHDLRSGATTAGRFDTADNATETSFSNVLIRRLGKQGGISTLSLAAA